MSNLTQRVLTAIVALPLLIWLFIYGGLPFAVLVGAATAVGLYEFFAMMEARGFKPMKTVGYALGIAFVAVAYLSEYLLTIVVTFSMLTVMAMQLTKRDIPASITGMAVTVFGLLYVAWLLSHAVLLRNVGWEILEFGGNNAPFRQFTGGLTDRDERFVFVVGVFFMFVVFACTFLNDTGAYFAGRFFGKHKLAPSVSPKKTWEGAVGGVFASTAGAAGVKFVFDSWVPDGRLIDFPYWAILVIGFVLAIASILGDLVESLIKRDADIKDSGWIIPGHGGILDRIDALLFTFPVTYYLAQAYYLFFAD